MIFPDRFIQELKARCEIEEIISEYVVLKRRGSYATGLCPFHSEKTPSFTVYGNNQSFYCFGCGAGGDVISFIRKIENLDYPDAIRYLSSKTGFKLPEDEYSRQNDSRMKRERYLEINVAAARFFHGNLMESENRQALDYLLHRGISIASIRRFGIGFAKDSWDDLKKHLLDHGFSEHEMIQASLCRMNKNGSTYDYFRNRIIFPIMDTRSNVIAFGGRVRGNETPKYLNSSDTSVFSKSNNLFSLNFAKNQNNGQLILCEGYMDVIAIHQAGFENAVATLGTAVTAQQARLMARYAKEIIIAYDGDAAGQTATKKATQLLVEAGLSVKVLRIPNGKDPDEYIQQYGKDRFSLLLQASKDHVEYRLAQIKSNYNLDIPLQKAAFLNSASEYIASLESPIERDIYLSRLSLEYAVSKDALQAVTKRQIKSDIYKKKKAEKKQEQTAILGLNDQTNPQKRKYLRAARAEELLIALLFYHPDYISQIQNFQPEDALTDFNRRVLQKIYQYASLHKELDISDLNAFFEPDEISKIVTILNKQEENYGSIQAAQDCVDVIIKEKNRQTLLENDLLSEHWADFLHTEISEKLKKGEEYE